MARDCTFWLVLVGALVAALATGTARASDETTTTPFDIFSPDGSLRLVARACATGRDKTIFVPAEATDPAGQWLRYSGLGDANQRFSILCWQPQPSTQQTTSNLGCLARAFTGELVTTSYKLNSKFLDADVFYHNEIVLSKGLEAITTAYALNVGGVSTACPSVYGFKPVLSPGVLYWNTNGLTDVAPFALRTSLDTTESDGYRKRGLNHVHP